jgi:uncharacterized protein (DUF488 family)
VSEVNIQAGQSAPDILTIGHSTHSWDQFLALLRGANVTAVADVRSAPYSRRAPQFSREVLMAGLREAGIAYVYLGKELGGRPADSMLYCDGVVDYERVAATAAFAAGLDRVIAGASRYRIALMCAERDPLACHRCLLVSRRLQERGIGIGHILADGRIQPHGDIDAQLLAIAKADADDMFASQAERLARAYRTYGRKAAFTVPEAGSRAPGVAD